jgi:hypothetical protein
VVEFYFPAVFKTVVSGFDMPNEAGSRRASCWVDHIANSNSSLACNEKPVSSADVRKAPESASKWNLEVSQLVSSESWLEMHGLKRAKLDLYSLLRQMGFRHANGRHHSFFYSMQARLLQIFLKMFSETLMPGTSLNSDK